MVYQKRLQGLNAHQLYTIIDSMNSKIDTTDKILVRERFSASWYTKCQCQSITQICNCSNYYPPKTNLRVCELFPMYMNMDADLKSSSSSSSSSPLSNFRCVTWSKQELKERNQVVQSTMYPDLMYDPIHKEHILCHSKVELWKNNIVLFNRTTKQELMNHYQDFLNQQEHTRQFISQYRIPRDLITIIMDYTSFLNS